MTKEEYFAKFHDPRWQKKRLRILERDNWECYDCGSKHKTLVAHHKYYIWENDPWNYPDEALITLCNNCHDFEHGIINYENIGEYRIDWEPKHEDINIIAKAIKNNFLRKQLWWLKRLVEVIGESNNRKLIYSLFIMLRNKKMQSFIVKNFNFIGEYDLEIESNSKNSNTLVIKHKK